MLVATSATSHAQRDNFVEPANTSDLQFFSPVEFDFENQPRQKGSGWFFKYDKLSWAATYDRAPVGDPSISYDAQSVWTHGIIPGNDPSNPVTGNITFVPPQPHTVVNSLNGAAPLTSFAWGERYEFGHSNGRTGWSISILDGPEHNQFQNFGFGVGDNQLGFGSVTIAMEAPVDYLRGFADLILFAALFNEGTTESLTEPIDIFDSIDDLNGNGEFDLEDTILFLPTWESVSVRNTSKIDGFELMKTFKFRTGVKLEKNKAYDWEYGVGVRYFRLRDDFEVSALGGVWGDSNWLTEIDNNIVGPQMSLRMNRQRQRWNINAQGRFVLGINNSNWEQLANFGSDLVPGGKNKPLFAVPTISHHTRSENEFAPLGELRVESSYQVTGNISLRLGYTATYIGHLRRAANQVHYVMPTIGLKDGGTQDIFYNGINFGFDVQY